MDGGQTTSWYLLHMQVFESKREEENPCELVQVLLVNSHFCKVLEIRLVPTFIKCLILTRSFPDITEGIYTLKSCMPDFLCFGESLMAECSLICHLSLLQHVGCKLRQYNCFPQFTNEKNETGHFCIRSYCASRVLGKGYIH